MRSLIRLQFHESNRAVITPAYNRPAENLPHQENAVTLRRGNGPTFAQHVMATTVDHRRLKDAETNVNMTPSELNAHSKREESPNYLLSTRVCGFIDTLVLVPLAHIGVYAIVDKTTIDHPQDKLNYWMWCSTNNYPNTPLKLWVECMVVGLDILHRAHLNNDVTDAQKLQVQVRVKMGDIGRPTIQ